MPKVVSLLAVILGSSISLSRMLQEMAFQQSDPGRAKNLLLRAGHQCD